MANEKKYYWLKLKDNFFDDDTVRFIEEQENGIKYSNFYLKLCLKSVRTNGKLIRLVGETLIPYDIKSLSNLTGVDFDIVNSAMQLFNNLGIISILDNGELYLSQVRELIGSETDKAPLMRRKRAEEKTICNIVTEKLPYIEKEIEKDIDIEKDKKTYRFSKPTLEELSSYIIENNYSINPQNFLDYYDSNGWKVGKNSMKDWKATVRQWNAREKNNKPNKKVDVLPSYYTGERNSNANVEFDPNDFKAIPNE